MTTPDIDPKTHRADWAALDSKRRRGIVRAVNRGMAVDEPADAAFAVNVARGQVKFWKFSWAVGPLIALIQIRNGWEVVLANAITATVVLGTMSFFFLKRIRRAEAANLEVLENKGSKRRSATSDEAPRAQREDHLPSRFKPDPNTSRSKVQRRKKKRR